MAATATKRKTQSGLRIIIVSHYAFPHSGGIEQATFNQAKELVRRGNHVTIVSSNIPKGAAEEVVSGVRFVRIAASRILEQGSGVPYTIFSHTLAKTLRELVPKCDIVHVHGSLYHSTWTALRVAKECKKPTILTEHVGIVPYGSIILKHVQAAAYKLAGTRAIRAASKIVVLTEEVRANVTRMRGSSDNITLIPNGIDASLFKPASELKRKTLRATLSIPSKHELIVFNGRLIEKKGYQLVLEALKPNQIVICIGSGAPPQKYLLNPNIRFIGTVPQTQVRDILQAADFYILPSVGEGFPVATMEALAVGVPCILSDTESNRHYVSDAAAIYVERTVADVGSGIERARKKTASLRKAARALAVKKMSITESVSKLLLSYREVIEK